MQRVTAAIWEENGKVFIARRKEGKHLSGKWEFPGGKIEPGESPEEALAREITEELGLHVAVGELLGRAVYRNGEIHLELLAYRVSRISGEVTLYEHVEARWVLPSELTGFDLAESDRKIVEQIWG